MIKSTNKKGFYIVVAKKDICANKDDAHSISTYESINTKPFLGPSSMMYSLFSFSIKI